MKNMKVKCFRSDVIIEKPCRLRWNALKCKLVAFNIQGVIF